MLLEVGLPPLPILAVLPTIFPPLSTFVAPLSSFSFIRPVFLLLFLFLLFLVRLLLLFLFLFLSFVHLFGHGLIPLPMSDDPVSLFYLKLP